MPVRKGHEIARPLGRLAFGTIAVLAVVSGIVSARQSPGTEGIVADVRAAMAAGGLTRGEEVLGAYRSKNGTTPESLEALCWLARGALSDQLYDRANRYSEEVLTLASSSLKTAADAERPLLMTIVESGLDVRAHTLSEQGARSEAVYMLRNALDQYRDTPIREQIQSDISLVTLEGHAAPAIDSGVSIGARLSKSGGQPQLLFFWAHWCQDCKAESPVLSRIAEKYRARGLAIVAPTRRYGYVESGRPADPAKELRHIVDVRDAHYPFLKRVAVPVTDANYKAFGVAAVPMHVLIDRDGVVRLYQPGRMSEAELDAAIAPLVNP
jgi:thiol-disulfide isomerase/thioredoxin